MADHEKLRELGIRVITTGEDDETTQIRFVSKEAAEAIRASLKPPVETETDDSGD